MPDHQSVTTSDGKDRNQLRRRAGDVAMSALELRRVVPALRDPFLCNWDLAVANALADWMERTADDFADLVKADAPDCPNCGGGYCAGHPEANWCDRCGNAVESPDYAEDPCRCWTEALATARALAVSFGIGTADQDEEHVAVVTEAEDPDGLGLATAMWSCTCGDGSEHPIAPPTAERRRTEHLAGIGRS